MDTTESLALVEDSMVALRAVQDYFPTKIVQKAVRMAESLVRMCQRSKLEAAETLRRSTQNIQEYCVGASGEKDSQTSLLPIPAGSSLVAVQENEASFSTVPRETESVGLDLFDWEKFLRSDFAFDMGFADH
jgi:hypothetical protein